MTNQSTTLSTNDLPQAPAWVRFSAALIRRLPAGRYRAMDILPRPSSAFLMHMAEEVGGYPFYCDLRDTISREVCFTGWYEPQVSALVKSILQPGMSFVDVGANWGYFTLMAASLVGPGGRVLSLEPDPRLFSILQGNVSRGRLDYVTAMQLAAAHGSGIVHLTGYTEEGGNFGISRITQRPEKEEGVFQVKSDSLDRILKLHGMLSVDLMKMDIEGGEVFAIAGLDEFISSRKIKRLILELHPIQLAEHGSDISAITDRLQSAGYKGWTIDHSEIATRETAYQKQIKANRLLRPFDPADLHDDWPHHLWLAPGVE